MPPKPKNTREEIAQAAFQLVKEEGMDALSARQIGKRLGCSAGSLFTLYSSMEEVKQAARQIAFADFREAVGDYKEYTPAFKRIGTVIVSYAINQPELFKLLFMHEHRTVHGFEQSIMDLGDIYDVCVELMMTNYELTEEEAKFMFEHLWTQAYGLAAMCMRGVCQMTDEEVGHRLGVAFMSIFMFIKSGKMNEVIGAPQKRSEVTDDAHDYSHLVDRVFGDKVD